MIVRELYEINEFGEKLYITYSTENKKILQEDTGIVYDTAIDIEGSPHTYIETEEMIEDDIFVDPQEALDIIFGDLEP